MDARDHLTTMETFDGSIRLLGISSLGLLSTAVVYVVCLGIYNVFLHPLRSYPGPKLWAASRLPWAYHNALGTINDKMLEFHRRYGACVRIAPDELSYATTLAWKDIYSHRQGVPEMPKDPLRQAIPPNGIPNMLGANRENHSRYRKLLSHAFSEKGMREQEPLIREYVDLLVDRLGEAAKMNTSQDMVAWYNRATFDIISDLAFGESFHCLRDRTTHDWIGAIWDNLRFVILGNLFKRYNVGFLMPHLLPKDVVEGRIKNYRYSTSKIDARIDYGAERGDFWDKIIIKSENDNKGGEGMSKGEMLNNASLLVFAGSETTATLLSGATFLLLENRDKLEKVTKEVRTSYSSSDDINLINVSRLKYLIAVLDESMRVYPPVPVQSARVVPKGGSVVNGKFVPEGVSAYNLLPLVFVCWTNKEKTSVNVQQYPAYHLEANFHRPNDFIPERWLDEQDPTSRKDDKAMFQPFAVGPRNCIGRNLAYAEMRLIMAKVLWNFDLSLDDGKMKQHDGTGEWLRQRIFGLWEKKPLWVKLTRRQQ